MKTDLFYRKLRPRKTLYEIQDDVISALWMRVSPKGKKTWNLRYKYEGNSRRMTLGHYPFISLSEARSKSHAALSSREHGHDPSRAARDAALARRAAPTFSDLLDEFERVELTGTLSGPERLRIVKKDCSALMDRKAKDITRREIVLILDEVGTRAPVLRNRIQSVLNRVFGFATERGILEMNPVTRIRHLPETSRSRVLSDAEIKALWNALESTETEIYIQTRLCIKAILLTGARPGEASGMRWDEISDGIWTLPAERTKTRTPVTRPVLPMLSEVLEKARQVSWVSPFVFASTRKADAPINPGATTKAILKHHAELGVEQPGYTAHDLRRTFRTRLAALGISEVVSEKLLGHSLGGVLAIYNRHDYLPEKRQALALWENELKRILKLAQPAQVVVRFPEHR